LTGAGGRRARGPAQVVVRAETPTNVDQVRSLLLAAFPTPAEADLVDALRRDAAWLPDLSLVALDPVSGEAAPWDVVGSVVLTRLTVGGQEALALAPLAVRPDRQGQGVGSALVHAALEAARAAGERLVVVLGEPAYYGRFGFVPAATLGVTGPYGDGEAFQALALTGAAPRGRAEYPSPFTHL
jgi:putative acetyltransferase